MNSPEAQKCIDACLQCVSFCNYCASACLREKDVKDMVSCIRVNMECAAICYTMAQLLSMGSMKAGKLCLLCIEICEDCAGECEKHTNEHCQECMQICERCADECRTFLGIK